MNRRKFITGLMAVAGMQAIGNVRRVGVPSVKAESAHVTLEYAHTTHALESIINAHRIRGGSVDVVIVDNVTPPDRMDIGMYEIKHYNDDMTLSWTHLIEAGDTAVMRIPRELYVGDSKKMYDKLALTNHARDGTM